MNEAFTLKDGTVVNGHVIESDNILFVYMYGVAMQDAFNLLIDPGKTEEISAGEGEQRIVYSGYNHLFCIREEGGGMISAGLKKV